jgi:hypothetical protein
MRVVPVQEVRLNNGVLGAGIDLRTGWIGEIYPGSDLLRFSFIQVGDYVTSPIPHGAIGELVKLQVSTRIQTSTGYLGGRLQNITVRLSDPARFEGVHHGFQINNPEYYHEVEKLNGNR